MTQTNGWHTMIAHSGTTRHTATTPTHQVANFEDGRFTHNCEQQIMDTIFMWYVSNPNKDPTGDEVLPTFSITSV